jgi:hypothetical protein
MKTHLLLAMLLLALTPSCKSNEPEAELPCHCGTAMADLEGCAHPACIDGKTNPANPACVCGSLEIPGAKKN